MTLLAIAVCMVTCLALANADCATRPQPGVCCKALEEFPSFYKCICTTTGTEWNQLCLSNGEWDGSSAPVCPDPCPLAPLTDKQLSCEGNTDECRCQAGYNISAGCNYGSHDHLKNAAQLQEAAHQLILTPEEVWAAGASHQYHGHDVHKAYFVAPLYEKTVSNFNNCNSSPCGTNEECTSTTTGPLCQCKPGFRNNTALGCIDIDECSEGSHQCPTDATCSNSKDGGIPGYKCICQSDGFKPFYNATADSWSCEDIDECGSKVHHPCVPGTCSNLIGTYQCHCPPGREGTLDCSSHVNFRLIDQNIINTGVADDDDIPLCELIESSTIDANETCLRERKALFMQLKRCRIPIDWPIGEFTGPSSEIYHLAGFLVNSKLLEVKPETTTGGQLSAAASNQLAWGKVEDSNQ